MARHSPKPKHLVEPGLGPRCHRCGERLAKITRAHIGHQQHRQPFYFKWWWRCLEPTCATSLVMPIGEPGAIAWNVPAFPIDHLFHKRERLRSRDVHQDQKGTTVPSCPFDLERTP